MYRGVIRADKGAFHKHGLTNGRSIIYLIVDDDDDDDPLARIKIPLASVEKGVESPSLV